MPFVSKYKVYKPKFAKELKEGLRADGMTIEECCKHWGTTRTSYNNWKRDIKEFREDCEFVYQDFYIYTVKKGWDMVNGVTKGNAVVYSLLMSHFHGISAKTETKITQDEQIKTININVIEGKKHLVIDQEAEQPKKLTAFEKFLENNKKVVDSNE